MKSKFPYLYPYSVDEARRRQEVELWRESFRANVACKNSIEAAIRSGFDGMYLNDDCAKEVIVEYGFKRVGFVLANTLQEKSFDGRFSRSNREWSRRIFVPPDENHNRQFVVKSHPAVLDGFVDEYRQAYQELGLFGPEHCTGDRSEIDYKGKVLVMDPNTLKEEYWRPQDLLWYAHDGFGCSPQAIGRSIRSTCLGDGESTRWNRSDFIGVLDERFLPDWARPKLEQIRLDEQSRAENAALRITDEENRQEMPEGGGMEMR